MANLCCAAYGHLLMIISAGLFPQLFHFGRLGGMRIAGTFWADLLPVHDSQPLWKEFPLRQRHKGNMITARMMPQQCDFEDFKGKWGPILPYATGECPSTSCSTNGTLNELNPHWLVVELQVVVLLDSRYCVLTPLKDDFCSLFRAPTADNLLIMRSFPDCTSTKLPTPVRI